MRLWYHFRKQVIIIKIKKLSLKAHKSNDRKLKITIYKVYTARHMLRPRNVAKTGEIRQQYK